MESTLQIAEELLALCSKLGCQSSLAESISSIFGVNYNKWSEVRLHAYVMRCHTLFFKTALMVCASGTDFTTIVKACVYSRESFKGFEECIKMAEQKKWQSDRLKREFVSSAKFGLGAFKLYMSLMPDKVLSMLEWVGFNGITEEEGLELIKDAAEMNAFFSTMSKMTPLNYMFIFQTQFGIVGERSTKDLNTYDALVKELIEEYPTGMFFRFLSGKNAQFSGDLEAASRFFRHTADDWVTFKHGCHWEAYWTCGMKSEWSEAVEHIKVLSDECFWSPAVINYMYAIALIQLGRDEDKQKIKELLENLESLRKRIGGKSVPDEKMCAQKAKMYMDGKTGLEYGFYEIAYVFNYIKIGNVATDFAKNGLKEISRLEHKVKPDDIPLGQFFKAIFHAQLDEIQESERLLSSNCEDFKDNINVYLYPSAQLELANLYRLVGDHNSCQNQLKLAKQRNHYPFEARLHYRCHGFEQMIKSTK